MSDGPCAMLVTVRGLLHPTNCRRCKQCTQHVSPAVALSTLDLLQLLVMHMQIISPYYVHACICSEVETHNFASIHVL